MLFTAFAQTQAMAAANLSLAMLGIFTIGLPILLVTRSNKTEGNRQLVNTPVNLWTEFKQKQQTITVVEPLGPLGIAEEVPMEEAVDKIINSEILTEGAFETNEISEVTTEMSTEEQEQELIAA